MRRVFNCGVGFVLVVPRKHADDTLARLKKDRIRAWMLGEVVRGDAEHVQYA